MAKMTINELRVEIAQMLAEAKKKAKKSSKASKQAGRAAMAYGLYDEAFDFSEPLGADNWVARAGAVNWGPVSFGGDSFDHLTESEEKALRHMVREVMEAGIVPAESAWQPLSEATEPKKFESIWEAAKHWYQKFGEGEEGEKPKKGQAFEQTKYKLDKKAQKASEPKK